MRRSSGLFSTLASQAVVNFCDQIVAACVVQDHASKNVENSNFNPSCATQSSSKVLFTGINVNVFASWKYSANLWTTHFKLVTVVSK